MFTRILNVAANVAATATEGTTTTTEETKTIGLNFLNDLSGKSIKFGSYKVPMLQFIIFILCAVAVVFLILFIVFAIKSGKRRKVWKAYKTAKKQNKVLVAVPKKRAKEVVAAMKNDTPFADEAAAKAPAAAPTPVAAPAAPVVTTGYTGPYVANKAYEQGAPAVTKANNSYIVREGQYVAKDEAYFVSEFESHVAGLGNVARDPEGYFVAENYKVGVLLRKDNKVYAQVYMYLKKDNQVLSAPITVRVDNEEAYSKAAFLFDVAARDVEIL